jgi:hypothetical protein
MVRLGVLTQAEWDAIDPALQAELDAEVRAGVATYGEAFYRDDRERHRADLSLAYGVC